MTTRHVPQPPTVGEVLRHTLDAQGVSQVDLAEHTGLTTKHVNQVLSDAVDLSPDVAVRFARALGIPAQVWLGIDAARKDWQITQVKSATAEPVFPKLRKQRDEARAAVTRLEREVERLKSTNTDQGLRDRLVTVRAVADEWRQYAIGHRDDPEPATASVWKAMAHGMCCVLAAAGGADAEAEQSDGAEP